MKILLITTELLPLHTYPVTGGGIRVHGLYHGLQTLGHIVVLAHPRELIERLPESAYTSAIQVFDTADLDGFVESVSPELVIFEQWGLATFLRDPHPFPVVIDFHGSLLLENSFRTKSLLEREIATKMRTLGRCHFFIVPGERQKYYFLSWLLASGMRPNEQRIGVLPVSLSPELPGHNYPAEPIFVYGGCGWPWIDSTNPLSLLSETLNKKKSGKLMIHRGQSKIEAMTGEHMASGTAPVQQLPLQFSERTVITDLLRHDALLREYQNASVALDVFAWNWERALAITTRTIEYMWSGLPVIYSRFAELSNIIEAYNAGWIVDPTDSQGMLDIFEYILEHPDEARFRGENAQRLVREHFTWDATAIQLKNIIHSIPRGSMERAFTDRVAEWLHDFEVDEKSRLLHLLLRKKEKDISNMLTHTQNLRLELDEVRAQSATHVQEINDLSDVIAQKEHEIKMFLAKIDDQSFQIAEHVRSHQQDQEVILSRERDISVLTERYESLELVRKQLTDDLEKLVKAHEKLMEYHNQLHQERDTLVSQLHEIPKGVRLQFHRYQKYKRLSHEMSKSAFLLLVLKKVVHACVQKPVSNVTTKLKKITTRNSNQNNL